MIEGNFLELTKKLISIPSVSGQETCFEVIDYVEKLFENTSYKVEKFVINNVPSLFVFHKKGYRYIMNGHLDVVPAKRELFNPITDGNNLYGRGASDMKSAAAAMIQVFLDLDKQNVEHEWALMLVTDEETGAVSGTKYLLETENKKSEFYLAGEPTNMKVNNAHKAVVWVEIEQQGKPAHASMPWEGLSATAELNRKINNLLSKYPTPKENLWVTTYNLSSFEGGGKGNNVVADFAKCFFDIRRIPEESYESVMNNLKEFFPGNKITVIVDGAAMYTDKDSEKMKKFAEVYEKNLNKTPEFFSVSYASDAAFYSQAGIDAINFGPVGGCMHQDEEWVSLKSLQEYKEFLEKLIIEF